MAIAPFYWQTNLLKGKAPARGSAEASLGKMLGRGTKQT